MLPPQALESLKLSTTSPNEVITVALSVEYDTGEILAYRVFPSLIGPVFPIDTMTANEIIGGIYVQSASNRGDSRSSSSNNISGRGGDGDNSAVFAQNIMSRKLSDALYINKDSVAWASNGYRRDDDDDDSVDGDDDIDDNGTKASSGASATTATAMKISKQQRQQMGGDSVVGGKVINKLHVEKILERVKLRNNRFKSTGGYNKNGDDDHYDREDDVNDDDDDGGGSLGEASGRGSGDGVRSTRSGYSDQLVRDLRTTYYLVDKICNRQEWIGMYCDDDDDDDDNGDDGDGHRMMMMMMMRVGAVMMMMRVVVMMMMMIVMIMIMMMMMIVMMRMMMRMMRRMRRMMMIMIMMMMMIAMMPWLHSATHALIFH
jgi:hypothetical protein